MKSCASKSAETRHFAPKMFVRCLVALTLSIIYLASDTARGADDDVNVLTNENHLAAPTATADKYSITMKDGTILVGIIEIKGIKFNTSYTAVDVSLREIESFSDGFLTLTDGSKLKGSFSPGEIALVTPRGRMNLPVESITVIKKALLAAKASDADVTPVGSIKTEGASASSQSLKIGMQYKNNNPSGSPRGGGHVYSSTIYIFGNQGVSVYKVVGEDGNVFVSKTDGTYLTSTGLGYDGLRGGRPKGASVKSDGVVVFGPGDEVPILENAPYKISGTSVYIDSSTLTPK